jgi:hypothetical protein
LEEERQRTEQPEQARRDAIPRLLGMGLSVEQVAEALGCRWQRCRRSAPPLNSELAPGFLPLPNHHPHLRLRSPYKGEGAKVPPLARGARGVVQDVS